MRTAVSGAIRTLFTADSVGGNPATSNVRSGIVYGPSNELTGTCAVPGASSVLSGVPVDNTTGTATISAASIRAALGLASANLDSQLATAAADSSGVSTLLGRLTSGRATGLDNLDATISSRLAPGGTLARVTLVDTVTTLTNAPSGAPSAATVASAVRTELATELARLDAAISSRLATSGYTTPPTAAAIATAVNSALDRTGYSLTSAERQAIATAVQAGILDEGDGQMILTAIVNAIGNSNVDQIALVAAIRADLERNGGTLATRLAASAYTAPLDAAGTRSAVGLSSGNLDAQLSSISSGISGLPSAASIASAVWSATTRTLTTAIDNSSTIAAAVWSAVTRTLTSSSAPSAADNAAAVRQELSTELGRIDATISSRVKPSDTLSRVTLVDTTTTLTQAPTVPTPQQIATATRQELAPELAHLDANVSSRQPQLERLSNVATTQEVGDIVEGALQAPAET